MLILGIESSCDETAGAVVEDGTRVLSSVIATSADMHAKTGGIIPEQAARKQVESIIPVINQALKEASVKIQDIDKIAVTVGPGLIGSLLVGVETAKTLAILTGKPIVPVNHLVGHLYANWLAPSGQSGVRSTKYEVPRFPAVGLVVSGGHTDMVLMKNHGDLTWIGGTRDDAAGEAFDKTARLLGLPYPGGPAISIEAEKFRAQNPKYKLDLFPRPIINENNFDFSFSGLKTSVLNFVKKEKIVDKGMVSAEIQEAIVDVLVKKSVNSIAKFKPKSFLVAGGVSANKRLREKFQTEFSKLKNIRPSLHIPEFVFCTDSASYICASAHFLGTPAKPELINAHPNLSITEML